MKKNLLITPEGTKDYLFEEASTRNTIENKLRNLFEQRGFCEVVTPTLEFLDVFCVNGHGIPTEDMFKLSDSKGRLMVMRPDSTMPIARLASTRLKGASYPLRLYYNQAVYSTTRSLSGRSDEIMQMGIELIGSYGIKADLEVVSTAMNTLIACKQNDFRIEIGHIGIFNTLISKLKIDDELKETLRALIESKNYPALNDILDKLGNSVEIDVIKHLPRLFGGKEVFKKAASLINDDETIKILDYLELLYDNLNKLGFADKISVDLGIVNRTDYYTGIVFKGYIEGHGEAVLSGGRYDSLLSQFGETTGAIGFAVNLDAVLRNALTVNMATHKHVAILVFSEKGYEIEGLRYLATISKEMSCEYCLFNTLDEAKQYANKKGISRIDIVTTDSVTTVQI